MKIPFSFRRVGFGIYGTRYHFQSHILADGQDKSCFIIKLDIGMSMYASEFYLLFLWKVFERCFYSTFFCTFGRRPVRFIA